MRIARRIALVVALSVSLTAGAQTKQASNGMTMTKIDPLLRDLGIQLALSALPPHLRDHATVYVLNPDKKVLQSPAKARMDSTHLLLERVMTRSLGLGR